LRSIHCWYYMQGLQEMKLNCKCIRIIFELFHYIKQSGGSMFLWHIGNCPLKHDTNTQKQS